MRVTPITPTATANNKRPYQHPVYGCEIGNPYRYRTTTHYTGDVTITDTRHGYRVYVPAEEAPRELQYGESSQQERAAYFTLGATVQNAAGRLGFLREGGVFEPVTGED